MANIGKWNAYRGIVSVLTTELNSLANNTISAVSAAIDNSTNLDIYADFELVLASLSPTAGAHIDVYIALALDGTNYPADAAATMRLQTTQLLFSLGIGTTASTAQRLDIRQVVIPPGTFKIYLDNQAGVSFGATLNTLKMNAYNLNLNG